MTGGVPTPDELRALLAHLLTVAAGGTAGGWRVAIGEVEKLPTWANAHANWVIRPAGTAEQLAAIEKAVQIVTAAHPYVAD